MITKFDEPETFVCDRCGKENLIFEKVLIPSDNALFDDIEECFKCNSLVEKIRRRGLGRVFAEELERAKV